MAVDPGDTSSLERIACYVLKPPISLARLSYEPGSNVAVYRGKYNPSTKTNFQALVHIGRWDPPRGPPFDRSPHGNTPAPVSTYDEFNDIPDHDESDRDFYEGEDVQ